MERDPYYYYLRQSAGREATKSRRFCLHKYEGTEVGAGAPFQIENAFASPLLGSDPPCHPNSSIYHSALWFIPSTPGFGIVAPSLVWAGWTPFETQLILNPTARNAPFPVRLSLEWITPFPGAFIRIGETNQCHAWMKSASALLLLHDPTHLIIVWGVRF